MSENPHGPNYYESQFGDRIRSIGKGGSTRPPARSSSGSTSPGGGLKTAGGVGGVIVLVLVLGGLRGWNSSSSRYSTRDFQHDNLMRRHEELRRLQEENPLAFPQPQFFPPVAFDRLDRAPLLIDEDVAYLPALCYRLYMEGKLTELTPARRVFDLLDDETRMLLRQIASNTAQEPAPEKCTAVLDALNRVLSDADFYNARYFHLDEADVVLRERLRQWSAPGKVRLAHEQLQLHRALLEAVFPNQIIRLHAQPLDDEERQQAVEKARVELDNLKKRYGDKIP